MPGIAKLLLVDSDPNLIDSGKQSLERHGYQVLLAKSGEAAISMLKERQINLMVLEINLQDVNGLEVLAFISKQEIPTSVIVVSSETDFDMVSKAFRFGAFDYLQKPLCV
jgi:DNA-binding NtrC family response regulator